MAKLSLVKGTTSYRAYIFVADSSVTTGAGKTGLAFNTASLIAYYVRPGASATAITLATQTVTGAYSSGGFVEVSSANMPGVYRLDIPDAALASGVNAVVVMLSGASGMAPVVLEIELTAVDNQDSVRAGMTALPNAAAGASGGLPTGDASGRVDVSKIAGQTASAAAGVTFPSSIASPTNIPSAATNASAVRTELSTELGRIDAATTSRATPAQVNAEVVDALSVDTYAEPGAVPVATASLKDKIGWLFMLARNKRTTTGSADAVRNDADSATVATATLADDGSTFSRGKYS